MFLEEKKENISKKQEAEKIIEMAECYLSDSKHFEKKGDLINAFGDNRTRTDNFMLAKHTLYQLSYIPFFKCG